MTTARAITLGAAALLLLASCGSDDDAAPATSAPRAASAPVESVPVPRPSPETSAEPTSPPSAPAATARPPQVITLRQIVQQYEQLRSSGTNFTEYAIETCYSRPTSDQPPFETPFASDPVPLDTDIRRGDVFLCTIRTEPPADVGDLGLIALDDTGTTATWGGSDYPEMPFVAAPGQLCREFLADPWLDGWLTEPDYIAIGKPNDAYTLLLAYWFLEGQPGRMDVDGNGIPCELLFDPEVVAQVWAGDNPPPE